MFNIEVALISFLNSKDFKAYADVPNPRPDTFVTVERTGGGVSSRVVNRATFAIQCWDTSTYKACCLAELLTKTVIGFTVYPQVKSVNINSVYNYPDDESARYQIITDIIYV